MKVPTACRQCRGSKRKCTRQGPGEQCDTCRQRSLACDGHLSHHHQGNSSRLLPAGQCFTKNDEAPRTLHRSTDEKGLNLPRGIAIELVDHYLDKIHDRPHSLFHPPTLRIQVHQGLVGTALLYAICALGAKFPANPDTRAWEARLASESKRLLQADLENVCLENIQTLLLVAMLNLGNGNTSSEALFFRIATTMSEILCLNKPAPAIPVAERETRQRVWWSLYMADMWCISGLGLASHMKDVPILIERPMDESKFVSLTPNQNALDPPLNPGLWAQMTTLVKHFGPIQDLNRHIVNGDISPAMRDYEVLHLSQQLESWFDMLPISAQLNPQNLMHQQEKGFGGLLISIHLAYHHYSTLLYFGFLEKHQEPSSTDRVYIERCKLHASSFSVLIRKSRQLKGCEAVYPLVGHMTTVSSMVLLHTLLFGETHELDKARGELNANFEALIELKQYWPATQAWIDRLILFQNACLLPANWETHRLDGWMLKLLIEHSLPIDARRGPDEGAMSVPPDNTGTRAWEFAKMGRYTDIEPELSSFS